MRNGFTVGDLVVTVDEYDCSHHKLYPHGTLCWVVSRDGAGSPLCLRPVGVDYDQDMGKWYTDDQIEMADESQKKGLIPEKLLSCKGISGVPKVGDIVRTVDEYGCKGAYYREKDPVYAKETICKIVGMDYGSLYKLKPLCFDVFINLVYDKSQFEIIETNS